MLNEENDVKIPVTSINTDHGNCLSISPMLLNTNQPLMSTYNSEEDCAHNGVILPEVDHNTQSDLAVLNQLQEWLKDYPTDMFINRVWVEYYKSEENLNKAVKCYFNILHESGGFPFGATCELA